jgi:hypothetical protein
MDYMIRFDSINITDSFFVNPVELKTADLLKIFKSAS